MPMGMNSDIIIPTTWFGLAWKRDMIYYIDHPVVIRDYLSMLQWMALGERSSHKELPL